jgi:hypothetical protein
VVEVVDHPAKEEPGRDMLRIGQDVISDEGMDQANNRIQQSGNGVEMPPIADGVLHGPDCVHCIWSHNSTLVVSQKRECNGSDLQSMAWCQNHCLKNPVIRVGRCSVSQYFQKAVNFAKRWDRRVLWTGDHP